MAVLKREPGATWRFAGAAAEPPSLAYAFTAAHDIALPAKTPETGRRTEL